MRERHRCLLNEGTTFAYKYKDHWATHTLINHKVYSKGSNQGSPNKQFTVLISSKLCTSLYVQNMHHAHVEHQLGLDGELKDGNWMGLKAEVVGAGVKSVGEEACGLVVGAAAGGGDDAPRRRID
jgi:hypothetical protein